MYSQVKHHELIFNGCTSCTMGSENGMTLSTKGLGVQVYGQALAAILLAFCEDCESHDGAPHFAPKKLLRAMGKAARRDEEQAVWPTDAPAAGSLAHGSPKKQRKGKGVSHESEAGQAWAIKADAAGKHG